MVETVLLCIVSAAAAFLATYLTLREQINLLRSIIADLHAAQMARTGLPSSVRRPVLPAKSGADAVNAANGDILPSADATLRDAIAQLRPPSLEDRRAKASGKIETSARESKRMAEIIEQMTNG